MAHTVLITAVAERQLRRLPVRDQRILLTAIRTRLVDHPSVVSNAIKKLRPNPLAQWELRVEHWRVLYNVVGNEVVLLLIGLKSGNKLIVDGEEFHGHRNDDPEPPVGESGGNPV